jgi:ParB-like chromosome segregation protein Spo0J
VIDTSVVAFGTKSRKRAAAARAPRFYPARIARQLALAHALQRRVDDGEFADYADMARALGFTRARITQLMDLLLLAPDIQDEILHLEVAPGAQPMSERALRDGVLRSLDWVEQRRRWVEMKRLFVATEAQPTRRSRAAGR